ncbi:MAG: DUF2950 family protein [Candidatus Delongbacteria bacterium]|nr:DUF2950 family protein [Candidatus Delongbacteria bacterium]
MKNKITIPGIIVTILATVFFSWGIYQLIYIADYPQKITDNDILNNEIEAFINLKSIISAQDKFYTKDLDENGVKNYAEFLPHLWIYARKGIEPLELKLISEEIAFSKSSHDGYKGYIYTNLHKKQIKPDELEDINYEKEWAVIAYPKSMNITGKLIFIANNDNEIFAKKNVYNTKLYPTAPEKYGWVRISSEDDVRRAF